MQGAGYKAPGCPNGDNFAVAVAFEDAYGFLTWDSLHVEVR
jgi:hypothetical protein